MDQLFPSQSLEALWDIQVWSTLQKGTNWSLQLRQPLMALQVKNGDIWDNIQSLRLSVEFLNCMSHLL